MDQGARDKARQGKHGVQPRPPRQQQYGPGRYGGPPVVSMPYTGYPLYSAPIHPTQYYQLHQFQQQTLLQMHQGMAPALLHPGNQAPQYYQRRPDELDPPPVTLSPAELKARLREQVEFYFSLKNLANDVFIVGLMDVNLFVPLQFIATFNRIRALTTDQALVVDAIRDSQVVELDDAGSCVRPKAFATMTRIYTERGWVMTDTSAPSAAIAPPAAGDEPVDNAAPSAFAQRRQPGTVYDEQVSVGLWRSCWQHSVCWLDRGTTWARQACPQWVPLPR